MEAQDPLSELADIHLPGSISVWPPALGWWILAAVLIILAAYCARLYILKLIRLKRLSYATKALELAYQRFSEQALFVSTRNQAGLDFLNEINSILKRVALLLSPASTHIAKLSGKEWLAFLDESNNSIEFSSGAGKALGDGIYRRKFDADGAAIYVLARAWVENYYKEASPGQAIKRKDRNSDLESANIGEVTL